MRTSISQMSTRLFDFVVTIASFEGVRNSSTHKMSILLDTSIGDVIIDLDYTRDELRETLSRNLIKLAECRYFTSTLVWNVQSTKFAQFGCPKGDGSGGCSYEYLLLDQQKEGEQKKEHRFLSVRYPTATRNQDDVLFQSRSTRGLVLAVPMMMALPSVNHDNDDFQLIGSQFMILTSDEIEGVSSMGIPIGVVAEDESQVLQKLDDLYCDSNGRPYVDIRIQRAFVVYDPFPSSKRGNPLHDRLMKQRGVAPDGSESPDYDRPLDEIVEARIGANEYLDNQGASMEETAETLAKRAEELEKKDAKSRAVVLEMLGDLPDADVKAPENVLFVCKLNPVTDDEDLELIFSRFDPNAKADIIRDPQTNDSLCYAFVEFSTKEQCTEAYFKMNNALIDDRRIKVDFSQSVSHIWNRFTQQYRRGGQDSKSARNITSVNYFPKDPYRDAKKEHLSKRDEYRYNKTNSSRYYDNVRNSESQDDHRRQCLDDSKRSFSSYDARNSKVHVDRSKYREYSSKEYDRFSENYHRKDKKARHRSRSKSRDRSRGHRRHEHKRQKYHSDRSLSEENAQNDHRHHKKESKKDHRRRSSHHDRDYDRTHRRDRKSSNRQDDRDKNKR